MKRTACAAAVALCACSCSGTERWTDFERMREQRRADPYEANAFFADGMVMRKPPEGTIPWEPADIDPAVATGMLNGAPVEEVPLPVTPELLAAGRRAFDVYCAVCHGPDATGQSVMAYNMPGVPPPSLVATSVAALPAGHYFDVISRGKNRMPAYRWALPVRARWAVIAYIRTLQRAHAPPAAAGQRTDGGSDAR